MLVLYLICVIWCLIAMAADYLACKRVMTYVDLIECLVIAAIPVLNIVVAIGAMVHTVAQCKWRV